MAINKATYLRDLRDFTVASLTWCSQAAEAEALKVNDIISALVGEAGRRASMSQQALDATKFMQKKIEAVRLGQGDDKITELVDILEHISKEHAELDALTGPIIEALQFQDRLRQNLENLGKVIDAWLAQRASVTATMDAAATLAYGKQLLTCTTSQAERAVIRQFIANLPEEEVAQDALFF